MQKASSKRKFDKIVRKNEIASLYLQGVDMCQIARKYAISTTQVWKDIEAIKKDWKKSQIISFNERQLKELAKLDELEREAWNSFQLSKKTIFKKSKTTGAKGIEIKETEEDSTGDPRYLEIVSKCIKDRCLILGLISKEKIETGTTFQQINIQIVKPTIPDKQPSVIPDIQATMAQEATIIEDATQTIPIEEISPINEDNTRIDNAQN